MMDKQPKFSVGDSVCERFPSAGADREIGIVVERYEMENEYQYVVKFQGGQTVIFFEIELLSASRPQ
jgi:hypothetical protein